MYEIDAREMSQSFFPIWRAAGIHLNKMLDGGFRSWLRAHPNPPFLEHLSFRLGNQLFFIRIEDSDGAVQGPGSLRGLFHIAEGSKGVACLMPMRRDKVGGEWMPAVTGWGLINAMTRAPLDPTSLVTDDKIEMTPWEVHDMAVQVVRESLAADGFQLMSWQGNPNVDPSIWFVGKSKGPEWVVVRAAKYPASSAARPPNWEEIRRNCTKLGPVGHFASVALASTDQPFKSSEEAPVPLYRGHGLHANFRGLE